MNTIEQTLQMAMKEQIKVSIHIYNMSFPYHDAIITNLDEHHITFLIPIFKNDIEYIKQYTYHKKLIVGIGYSRVSLSFNMIDEIDDDEYQWT
jgi:hypothetical protein